MQSSVGGYSPAHAYSPTTHSRVSSMLIPPGTHRPAHGAQLPAGTSQLVEAESSEAAWRQAEGGRGGADWEDSEADLPAGEPSWAVQADMILRDVQARIEDELHREELLKDHLAMLQERHRAKATAKQQDANAATSHRLMLERELKAERNRCREEQAEIQRLEEILINTPCADVVTLPAQPPIRGAY